MYQTRQAIAYELKEAKLIYRDPTLHPKERRYQRQYIHDLANALRTC